MSKTIAQALNEAYSRVRGDRDGHTARSRRVVDHVLRTTGTRLDVGEVEKWIRDQDEGRVAATDFAEAAEFEGSAGQSLDDWVDARRRPLQGTALSPQAVARLQGLGIETLGDLADACADDRSLAAL